VRYGLIQNKGINNDTWIPVWKKGSSKSILNDSSLGYTKNFELSSEMISPPLLDLLSGQFGMCNLELRRWQLILRVCKSSLPHFTAVKCDLMGDNGETITHGSLLGEREGKTHPQMLELFDDGNWRREHTRDLDLTLKRTKSNYFKKRTLTKAWRDDFVSSFVYTSTW
jgi:hypothetical protein